MIVKAFAAGDRDDAEAAAGAGGDGPTSRPPWPSASARAAPSRWSSCRSRAPTSRASGVIGDLAKASVRFLAEFRSRSKGPEGEAVDDRRTAEVWTFQRNLTSRDPELDPDPRRRRRGVSRAAASWRRPGGAAGSRLRARPAAAADRAASAAPSSLADLPGWDAEDHAAAFAVVPRACAAAPAIRTWPRPALRRRRGRLARTTRPRVRSSSGISAPQPVDGEGLLTGYFAPVYEARCASGRRVHRAGAPAAARSRRGARRAHGIERSAARRRAGLDAAGGPVLPAGAGLGRADFRGRRRATGGLRRRQRPAVRGDRPAA